LRQREQVLAFRPSICVGDQGVAVSPLDYRSGDETEEGLLGHPAKGGGLRRVAELEVRRGNSVVRVGCKGERHPDIGKMGSGCKS
jgi:hypothetical protein